MYAADYYPYGKILREYNSCNQNRYLSTRHERDKDTGYDNRGARLYDSEIGGFTGVDPLASKFPAWSPYNYVMGNPVSLIDPDGRMPSGGGPGDGLINSLVKKAKRAAGTLAKRVVSNVAKQVGNAARDIVDNLTLEAKIEETASVGAQYGIEADKHVGVMANAGSLVLLRGTIGAKVTSDGVENTTNMASPIIPGQPATVRSNFDLSAGNGAVGGGFSIENEVDIQSVDGSLEVTRHEVEGDVGVSTGPIINFSAGAGTNTTTGKNYLKASVGAGVEGAVIFGVKFEAKVELRYNFD